MSIPWGAIVDGLTKLGAAHLQKPLGDVLRQSGWGAFIPRDPHEADRAAELAADALFEELAADDMTTIPPGVNTADTLPSPPPLPREYK